MAESADATDLKSVIHWVYGFKSRSGYHFFYPKKLYKKQKSAMQINLRLISFFYTSFSLNGKSFFGLPCASRTASCDAHAQSLRSLSSPVAVLFNQSAMQINLRLISFFYTSFFLNGKSFFGLPCVTRPADCVTHAPRLRIAPAWSSPVPDTIFLRPK